MVSIFTRSRLSARQVRKAAVMQSVEKRWIFFFFDSLDPIKRQKPDSNSKRANLIEGQGKKTLKGNIQLKREG